jgi:cytochrome c-type biogenesis protein CcmH
MRHRAASLSALAAACWLLFGASSALAASASLPDLEDEVMCTICGTTLQLANSPQAERERALINSLIAEGKDKDQIKDALVAEYGPAVLAVPDASGFGLTAFIVPILGIAIALIAIALAARRWRRARRETVAAEPPPAALSASDEERLRVDLGRYES